MSALRTTRPRHTWWSTVTSARGLAIAAIIIAVGAPASAATVLITSKQLAANSVTSKAIKNGSVTNADLAFVAVTSKNLAKGSVGSSALGEDAVTSANLAAGAVTASDIASGTITAAQLAPGTIPAAPAPFVLTDGIVTAAKLANGSVTTAKLGSGSVGSTAVLDGSIAAADLAPAIGASLDENTVQAIAHDAWNGNSAQNYIDEELDGFFIDFTTNTTPWATTGMVDTATHPDRITVTTSGLYQVNAASSWNPNNTGYREISIVVNGTQGTLGGPGTGTVAGISRVQASSNTTRTLQTISSTVALTAGDYVGVRVSQDTGLALNLLHGSLSLVRIGSIPS